MLQGISASECDQTNASCFSLRAVSLRKLFLMEITQDFWFLHQYLWTAAAYLEGLPAIHHPQKSKCRGEIPHQLLNPLKQENYKKPQKPPAGVAPGRVCLGELCLLLLWAAVTTETVLGLSLGGSSLGLPADPGHTSFNLARNSPAELGLISVPLNIWTVFPRFQQALDQPHGYPGTDF